ncbi:MAG: hypothetical protein V4459_03430 [Pseudomonadota bacterium]
MLRVALRIVGVLAIAMGLLWFLQGTGVVHWPASSFMLDVRIWALWGALLAAGGVLLVWLGRRR